MNHFTISGFERGGISHEVDRMKPECFAAVSMQRRTSASISVLVVFSNLVASTLPIATARPWATSMKRFSWSTYNFGSPCWSRSNETVVKPQPMMSSEEHTSELQSHHDLVCRLLLEKKQTNTGRPARCIRSMCTWYGQTSA